jgi:hypothetical protein
MRCAVVIPEAETGDFWTSCREVEEGFKPKIWTPALVTRVLLLSPNSSWKGISMRRISSEWRLRKSNIFQPPAPSPQARIKNFPLLIFLFSLLYLQAVKK